MEVREGHMSVVERSREEVGGMTCPWAAGPTGSGRASIFREPMVSLGRPALARFPWPREVYPHPYLMRDVAY